MATIYFQYVWFYGKCFQPFHVAEWLTAIPCTLITCVIASVKKQYLKSSLLLFRQLFCYPVTINACLSAQCAKQLSVIVVMG